MTVTPAAGRSTLEGPNGSHARGQIAPAAGLLSWGSDQLTLEISWSEITAPRLSTVVIGGRRIELPAGLALVQLVTAQLGHAPASGRLVHTAAGSDFRYLEHRTAEDDRQHQLNIVVVSERARLRAELVLIQRIASPAVHATVTVTCTNGGPVIVRSVASFCSYLGFGPEWTLFHGQNDWLAEGRWSTQRMPGTALPDIAEHLTGHNPRGTLAAVSTGTWSTGAQLPVAIAVSGVDALAWGWQIEHNGAWRWEIGHDTVGDYIAASGPTHRDHNWMKVLDPGESFTTVPVTFTVGDDFDAVVGDLTSYRRDSRRDHRDNQTMPVIFNDYMNTLNGDPTTDKLLPLIDAAAAVGAKIFCIDAGWYDDSGDWWDSVGEWSPSVTRFPHGLAEVVDRIRERGMVPGLWLEPEVVGVKSPVAATLPDEAFFCLAGQRMIEHGRYHLDLRHPAARTHLNAVVDGLIRDYGIGYFKFDYNIDPGTGSDTAGDSTGSALLDHNRSLLNWLDTLLDRHPGLVIENCGSGAMRSDWAMMSRLQLQSTSDQQDFTKYPPIAASAPMTVLPEQAASWGYPQPSMTDEEIAFCLVTSLVGRLFLSGYLNRMDDRQLALVRDAVTASAALAPILRTSTPFWPIGLPQWDDPWIAVGLRSADALIVAVWSRRPEDNIVALTLPPEFSTPDLDVDTIFPRSLDSWPTSWDEESGTISIRNASGVVGARMFRLSAPDGDHIN